VEGNVRDREAGEAGVEAALAERHRGRVRDDRLDALAEPGPAQPLARELDRADRDVADDQPRARARERLAVAPAARSDLEQASTGQPAAVANEAPERQLGVALEASEVVLVLGGLVLGRPESVVVVAELARRQRHVSSAA
jgi:hypothetical protein